MKQFCVIIFVIPGQFAFAQMRQDTTIPKRTLDSLLQKLATYKDILRRNYFDQVIEKHTISVDSVSSHEKNTLTVLNVSKTKTTLRKQEFHLDKAGCKTLLIDDYYDTTGRKLYKEQWKMGCGGENDITGFLQYRYRYHYDDTGKETGMTMESYDGGGHRVQRFTYTVQPNGEKVWVQRVKLNEYAFWD
jgi:hypothetical protein